jgi:hypothetical protein
MKHSILASVIFAACLCTGSANAASSEGTVSANVVERLSINNQSPLNFGFITPTGGGNVTITTNNQRNVTGDVDVKDAFGRGVFHVRGAPGKTYSIQTPASQTFVSSTANTDSELTNSLTVDNFNIRSMNSANSSGLLNSNGEDTVYLGGTLTVPANAVPGVYSGVVNLTVSY